ncbi:MAG: YybH family protein [Gemmobacter sp.]
MMRRYMALAVVLALGSPALASPQDEVRALYETFAAAQNARDLGAVRAVLSDSPDFLWISDGRPVWGREEMLERMAGFQKAEVWRVEPEYAASRVVLLDDDTAVFHIPLVLVLGSSADPARLKWLVEVLCQKEADGWRIAGLFTAEDKRK